MSKEAMLRLFNSPKFNISENTRINMIQSMFDSQNTIYGFFEKAKDLEILYKHDELNIYFNSFLNTKR